MCQESLTQNKWVGIPYLLNGRDMAGTDCLGLVWMYLRDQGIVFPDGDGLPIDTTWTKNAQERMINKLREIAVKIEVPRANDVVLIHWVHQAAHLGVMVDNQNMLHISFDRTSEICPVTYFGHRVLGIWRVVK